jgi:HAD superfamily hydrolase (TIGR01490 family)
MGLVLIDVDGTLIDGPSSERRFIRHLLRSGSLGPVQLAAFSLFPVRYGPRFGHHVFKKNKAYLRGLATSHIEEMAKIFVRDIIVPDLRGPLLEHIAKHRTRGTTLALLTGTPSFIAHPLAAHLGVDHVVATRCRVADGRYLGLPPLSHPFGAEKVKEASALCRRLGVRLGECVAYADSAEDIPLMRAVARAVAVAPDRALATEARRRRWPVLVTRA